MCNCKINIDISTNAKYNIFKLVRLHKKRGDEMELNLTAIRVEMAKKNWNLKELSKKAKVPYTTITSIMSGKRGGTIKTIGKIAKGLNVDVTDLLKDI